MSPRSPLTSINPNIPSDPDPAVSPVVGKHRGYTPHHGQQPPAYTPVPHDPHTNRAENSFFHDSLLMPVPHGNAEDDNDESPEHAAERDTNSPHHTHNPGKGAVHLELKAD